MQRYATSPDGSAGTGGRCRAGTGGDVVGVGGGRAVRGLQQLDRGGRDGLGVVRRTSGITATKYWYLRNTITTSSAQTIFKFGAGSQRPVVWTIGLA